MKYTRLSELRYVRKCSGNVLLYRFAAAAVVSSKVQAAHSIQSITAAWLLYKHTHNDTSMREVCCSHTQDIVHSSEHSAYINAVMCNTHTTRKAQQYREGRRREATASSKASKLCSKKVTHTQ